jgi:hypothetical protein
MPQGLSELEYIWQRHDTFYGHVRQFSQPIQFVEDGKVFIDAVIEIGINEIINCYLDLWDSTDNVWRNILDGVLNIPKVKQGQILEDAYATEVNFENGQFEQLLTGRADVEVDYYKTKTLNGLELSLTPFNSQSLTLRGIAADTTCIGIYPFELVEKIISIITNTEQKLSASVLDRIARGASSDGKLAYTLVTKGKLIRGYDESDVELNISLTTAFKALDVIGCLGLYTQTDELGNKKVYIENKKYFFNDAIVMTLTDIKGLSRTINDKLVFSEIEAGYSYQNKTEDTNAAAEYNTSANYCTIIASIVNKLSLISKICADGSRIEFLRTQPKVANGKIEGDDELFFIESFVDTDDLVKSKDENNYLTVTGNGGSLNFNLGITPARIIHAWGSIISCGLQQYKESNLYFSTSKSKLSNIITQKSDDFFPIADNVDIPISDLDTPFVGLWKYNFDAAVTIDDIIAFKDNPHGMVRFWDYISESWKYGYAYLTSFNPIKLIATFELWEREDVENIEETLMNCWLCEDGGAWLQEDSNLIILEAA